jgi:sugar lactone lactonase YvrE
MNPVRPTKLTRSFCNLGLAAVVAGLVYAMGALPLHAQNAAQRAALARLGHFHALAHPNDASSSGEAANATLDQPGGLAFDAAGNLYIADTQNNVVREINLAGVISTVAGSGEQGFAGDGASATSAALDAPTGVAVDANGNLYIGDTHNNRIREVMASSGNISTIAGNGTPGFSGDGGTPTAASLAYPTAIAVDSAGNIYIADTNNNRIREIVGATIETVAGSGMPGYSGDNGQATAASLDSPQGVAVDAAFNIYIGDTNNNRVRMVTYSTGVITTIAGNGTVGYSGDGGVAASGSLDMPTAVAVDGSGNVYVADSNNQRIRMIGGGNLSTVVGSGNQGFGDESGTAALMSLDTPRAVAVSGTSVVLADTQNNRVVAAAGGGAGTIAGQPPANVESLVIGGASPVVYGTGTLTATLADGALTGTGLVSFYDGFGAASKLLGSAPLASNAASIGTGMISAGTHSVVASYAGDANNAPATSGVYMLVVTPAQVTAIANAVSLMYGQPVPALNGVLNNVLAQDTGKVTATFSTTAIGMSAPGVYPIAASLSGPSAGNYSVALGSGSGAVTIAKAPANTALTISSQTPIFDTSLTLTANVASTTSGAPTGSASFYDGATLLNATPATISGGYATAALSALSVGAHSITAVYSGDSNFLGSTSSSQGVTVLSPEFSVAASPAAQTVLPLHSALYTVTLTPTNSTFVYPVTLSASGLPTGVTASFSPASIAVGTGAATSVMTLNATDAAQLRIHEQPLSGISSTTALALLILPFAFSARTRRSARHLFRSGRMLIALLAFALIGLLAGCGGGGFFSHPTQTSTVTITATGGPVTHTTTIAMTLQ